MRSGNTSAWLAAVIVVIGATGLSAHRRDEYLQAARLAVAPGRVELQLDLTPGIAIAETVIANIDRDRDGQFSSSETGAYIAAVMSALELRLDGAALPIPTPTVEFPNAEAFRRGEGTIRIAGSIALPRIHGGAHALTFRNGHQPESSVYLANALVPDGDQITIDAQRRDPDQRELTIDYIVDARTPLSLQVWLVACAAGLAVLGAFATTRSIGRSRTAAPSPGSPT